MPASTTVEPMCRSPPPNAHRRVLWARHERMVHGDIEEGEYYASARHAPRAVVGHTDHMLCYSRLKCGLAPLTERDT